MTMIELDITEQAKLFDLERKIEAGLQTFVEVGLALMEIRDSELYRSQFGTFEEYCGVRWGFTSTQAKRLMDGAEIAKNIEPSGSKILAESHLRPLKNLQPAQQREVYSEAVATAPNGRPTAAHVADVARRYVAPVAPPEPSPVDDDDEYLDELTEDADGYDWTDDEPVNLAPLAPKPHVAHNSGNNEWYTPAEYIEAARAVMGDIDLDPATSCKANEIVGAKMFYTAEDDGLLHPWSGRVWMNPPYSSDLIKRFAEKIAFHYEQGDIPEAIILVNNATETGWFQTLIKNASAVNFPGGRVRFWQPDGDKGAPLQGQAIIYLGDSPQAFGAEFSSFGWCAFL